MRFKTVRLTAIRNGPKRTISTSCGLGLLQEQCQRGCWAPKLGSEGGGLRDSTSVGEGNEAFFIRVWKSLPSIRVLKL